MECGLLEVLASFCPNRTSEASFKIKDETLALTLEDFHQSDRGIGSGTII
jgi:hypothetical protein